MTRVISQEFTVVSAKAHTFPPSTQVEWENQLLHAFIFAGWAFNSISDLQVQKLFHDFIPGAMVPTHQKLCNQTLTQELGKMEGSVREVSKGALATIQCDGWKDISKKHLVAFMFTANREVNFESFHSNKVGLNQHPGISRKCLRHDSTP
jgi:hypothetical protein